MAVVKVIELLAESDESWEDAVQRSVTEASRTIKNIREVYVQDFKAIVQNDRVSSYRLNVKLSFVVAEDRESEEGATSRERRGSSKKRSR